MTESALKDDIHETLKTSLLKWLPEQSRLETPISGLALTRHDENSPAIRCFYNPMVALVVQGFKRSMIGDHEANYGELHCVTVGIDMPGVFHVTNASPQAPFLSLSVKLDRRIIAHLMTEDPSIVAAGEVDWNPVVVAEAGKELLQAFVRLVELLDTPSRIPVIAPMILREIHYYLLCGNQGRCLRLFSTTGTQANQIAEAISWLREHYADSINMEELARRVNMASSTFNRHFRQVTSLSPLQFQKRLRLYEAERLMLQEGKDAGTAALMVGYESGSQFNREYKRQFGAPPRRDVAQKRF
ncbi:MAG TPA: AraC family transcriptional regulator [Candidatus Mailhella merdigallinarum]|uniref:AraC family transcriptional regulator n=1 Tax=Candidatus Mailhella merdigallinarum TaxID=2838658 RepID=A0A9D2KMC9_9BACT|nr:AraC family transcriptional regulator [Candidatus Mailhella merdigallinarum]